MPFLFSACPLARHYAVFFRLRLLARHCMPVIFLTLFIVPDRIRHSSFILSDAIRATFTLSYIGVASSSAYLCLFRHKTLPISAYLSIKWHIFVKSEFFSSIGLLATYPILYLCTVKGQSGSPTDANGVHPVGRAAHIRVTSLKTQF